VGVLPQAPYLWPGLSKVRQGRFGQAAEQHRAAWRLQEDRSKPEIFSRECRSSLPSSLAWRTVLRPGALARKLGPQTANRPHAEIESLRVRARISWHFGASAGRA